jgi:4a-hydroxytetrahydrobiopterin dehydratase
MKALSENEIKKILKAELKNWIFEGACISRIFKFSDFVNAFSFMTSVALHAEKADHHPDWSNIYNIVNIRLNTHDAGGITVQDLDLARTIDSLSGNFV